MAGERRELASAVGCMKLVAHFGVVNIKCFHNILKITINSISKLIQGSKITNSNLIITV